MSYYINSYKLGCFLVIMNIKRGYYSQEKRPEINITQTPQGVFIFHCVGGRSNYNVADGQASNERDLYNKHSNFLRHEKKSPIRRSILTTDDFPASLEYELEFS